MIFDEYTEELNDTVMYGITYKLRMSTPYINIHSVDSGSEEQVTKMLKVDALNKMRNDIEAEILDINRSKEIE